MKAIGRTTVDSEPHTQTPPKADFTQSDQQLELEMHALAELLIDIWEDDQKAKRSMKPLP